MARIQGFPPIADSRAKLLILGSMPGKASLQASQYYAHQRNAFWPIMGEIVGATPDLPYPLRLQKLKSAGIALWDVLAACSRDTSLDADIDAASMSPNDFVGFFLAHPQITEVFFNGSMAEKCFRSRVQATLEQHALSYQRLPSTSPANAGLSYAQKLQAWQVIAQRLDL